MSIMIKEQNAYAYLLGPTRPVEVDYELSEKARESFYKDLLGNLNTKTSPSACFKAVTDGCITKHMAFRAENESRIFCWVKYQVDPGSKKSAKKIHFRTNDNVPYIRLNENSNRLPIKKIIVGPHRLQEERYQKLCIWLNVNGQNPEIVKKSNIPYIGIKV